MTAAIWPGERIEDLEGIVFGGPRCTFCGEEATYTGLYEPIADCPHTEWDYCTPHTQAIHRKALKDGLEFKCSKCSKERALRYIKVVPIR